MAFEFNLIWQAIAKQAFANKKEEELAKTRLAVCALCPHIRTNAPFKLMDWVINQFRKLLGKPIILPAHTGYKCGACGCNLNTKSRHPKSACPKGRWPSDVQAK